MNESLMYGSEDKYKTVTFMLSLTTWMNNPNASGDLSATVLGVKPISAT